MDERRDSNSVGAQIKELRDQLGMTIDTLAIRSNVDVEAIKELESGSAKIELDKIDAIAKALVADLTFELTPVKPVKQIIAEQARLKAVEIVRYVQGTMSLEAQQPSQEFVEQLIESQTHKLLTTHRHLIWEES